MKRAALLESIRRGISSHMVRRMGKTGAAAIYFTEVGMRTPATEGMANDVLEAIEAEHPGAIEP